MGRCVCSPFGPACCPRLHRAICILAAIHLCVYIDACCAQVAGPRTACSPVSAVWACTSSLAAPTASACSQRAAHSTHSTQRSVHTSASALPSGSTVQPLTILVLGELGCVQPVKALLQAMASRHHELHEHAYDDISRQLQEWSCHILESDLLLVSVHLGFQLQRSSDVCCTGLQVALASWVAPSSRWRGGRATASSACPAEASCQVRLGGLTQL